MARLQLDSAQTSVFAALLRLTNALMQKELEMKLITILLFVPIAAFAQTAESRKPVTDAEKVVDASRAGPEFVTKDATLLVRARANGHVSPVFLVRRMMSPAALTRSFCSSSRIVLPVVRPMCRVSEFHICMVASGCLTSRMRWEAAVNSTLGHTS
jgi:hypothetical protein